MRDIINLCDSDSDADIPSAPVKLEVKLELSAASVPQPEGRFPKRDLIHVSRTEKVERVVHLKCIPERFEVPDADTACVLDFSNDARAKKETRKGKPKGLDAFLKAEVSDGSVRATRLRLTS